MLMSIIFKNNSIIILIKIKIKENNIKYFALREYKTIKNHLYVLMTAVVMVAV